MKTNQLLYVCRQGTPSKQIRNLLIATALVFIGLVTTPLKASDSTYTVSKVGAKDGSFPIDYVVKGEHHTADISVEQGDDRAAIAGKIASAIGNGATAKGNKVTFPSGAKGSGAHLITNDFATLVTNDDLFDHCPGLSCPSAGVLILGDNPFNGEDTLVSNAIVTAGFASGLGQVSFEGMAGETIDQLTLQLDHSLTNAGYTTQMLDAHDIEVFANGVGDPTEMDFSIDPEGQVGDRGILYGIDVPGQTPEPSSLFLLGSGVLGLSGFLRKRRFTRS